ncbi:hypothetical protein ACKX2L_03300 [Lachnospiraceae bacterium YH-ros2228]
MKRWIGVLGLAFVLVVALFIGSGKAEAASDRLQAGKISDLTLQEGSRTTLSVQATGDGLDYQWQYKFRGSNAWVNWGTENPCTPIYTADHYWQGMSYRVIVRDAYGTQAVSNEGKVTVTPKTALTITRQPENVTLKEGARPTYTAQTTGEGLSYRWQYKFKGSSTWADWGQGNPFTPICTADKYWQGMSYRYIVTDNFGNSMISKEGIVTVVLKSRAAITNNIPDLTLQEGSRTTLSVQATGDGLDYQWQYKFRGSNAWMNWGTGNPCTPIYTADPYWQGMSYRVIVRDAYGTQAVSNEGKVTVTPKTALTITRQPEDVTLKEGARPTYTAQTTGEGLSYRWQYKFKGSNTWVDWGQRNPFTPVCTADKYWWS